MITNKLQTIESLNGFGKVLKVAKLNAEKADITNLGMMPLLYDKFKAAANPGNKDNVKIFVFLMFFIYSPASCVGRGVKGGVRRNIAKLLNVSNAAISMQLGDAKVLFKKHVGFRKEVERLYQCILDTCGTSPEERGHLV